ncbi:MAG: zf-HC2 domain-containing protein, partial [Acidobacteriaceae bacterium]
MPSLHPEADVLTAFAENGLTSKERQQVVEHLATCNDCREIVFLAQPEMAQMQETFAPARVGRFRWMAWASVVAVVVVVGSAVLLQRERVTNPELPAPIATTSSKVETKAPEADQQRDTAALASSEARVEHAPAQPSARTRTDREAKGKAGAETQFAITPKKDEAEIAGGELPAPKPVPAAEAPVVQGQDVGGLVPQQ